MSTKEAPKRLSLALKGSVVDDLEAIMAIDGIGYTESIRRALRAYRRLNETAQQGRRIISYTRDGKNPVELIVL